MGPDFDEAALEKTTEFLHVHVSVGSSPLVNVELTCLADQTCRSEYRERDLHGLHQR